MAEITFSEKEHARVLMCFYQCLTEELGYEKGREAFLTCERAYGSRRGRRMAMKALRDGNPLDFTSYFAYGELLSTEGAYEGSFTAEKGYVHEFQNRCPWASAFGEYGGLECAKLYCTEIDAAIVRGFNPLLDFEYVRNMHVTGRCEFYFRGQEIDENTMDTCKSRLKPGQFEKRNMTFHTGDVYQMFCQITGSICPKVTAKAKDDIRHCLGEEAFMFLEKLSIQNYEII